MLTNKEVSKNFDLFESEKEVIDDIESLFEMISENKKFKEDTSYELILVSKLYQLLDEYKKLYKTSQRIMRMSDRRESEVRKLNLQMKKQTVDLEISKRSTEQILANIVLPVLITSKSKRIIVYANQSACNLYEKSYDNMIGAQLDDIYTLDNGPERLIEKLKTEGRIDSLEENITTNKGKNFIALLSVTPVHFKDEDCYIGMTVDITAQKNMENEVRAIHKHTKESIEYASIIQSALLPEETIFNKYFSDYFIHWMPKDTVGGDIYFFEELRHNNEFLLMYIDCTGHGVPGAFVTMLVKAVEQQIIADINNGNEDVSPAKILTIFNTNIKHLLKQDKLTTDSNAGFDGGIIYYNKDENILKFSGAETPLFYIDETNECKMIKGNRHSVGYKSSDINYEFKEHYIKVQDGMKFYLTTDGYIDQNGGEKSFPFGKNKFKSLIEKNHNKSFKDQKRNFISSLYSYQGNEERNDDITLIGFQI